MLSESEIKMPAGAFQELTEARARRLLQLSSACLVGMIIAAIVADGATKPILMGSVVLMFLAGWLAWRRKTLLSATILLLDLTVMLSVLVWVSGGIHDIAMLGYPMVLVLAAILGNAYLFLGLLAIIILYCSLVAVLTVKGTFVMVFPPVTYSHVLYVDIIFLITGFGVYLLALDLHRLMLSLKEENARVLEREQLIVRLANRDQLTDLHNRRYAEFHFNEFLSKAYQEQKKVAVFFLDLDNFKPVNDSLGHAAGDQLLRQLSQRLQTLSAPDDMLCRFGGDEFLWIRKVDNIPALELEQVLNKSAEQLLAAANTSFFIMENKIDISASVGMAIAPTHGETFIELCRFADLAMYHAKTKGRNTFSYYYEDLNRISIDKYHLLKNMREALSTHQFEVWYQPKVSLQSEQLIGCEALIRWPQQKGGFISPDEFIPLAESSGLIVGIGEWVLEQACQACADWRAAGFSHLKVAVNVSYVQFRDGEFPATVERILRQTGVPATALELELTESLLIDDEDQIQKQLAYLHGMGVSLAIDDFGTGYSNLGYLRRFNARCLKIDKSFVSALGVSDRDEPLVKAMIQMAHSLGLQTIAEGVEDENCLRQLITLGCDEGQGYLWSPAMHQEQWLTYMQQYTNS